MPDYITSSLIAVLACLFCIWLLRPLAVRIGLVDSPSERKLHENETPLIGGIAIFFGFCFALLHLHVSLQPYRGLLSGSALLVLMGIVDDFHDLSARLRLFGQLMAAIMLTSWGGLLLANLGNILFFGNIPLNLWALPFTVVFVVASINAMNMIDGQDGLAGSIALGQAFWLLIFAHILHLNSIEILLIIFSMLLLVFLSFNMSFPWRRQASIFLGDSGSTFIAFVLIWAAIQISQAHMALVRPVEILWVMALPLFDLLSVIFYRVRHGKSIFRASRDHLHHVLYGLGIHKTLSTILLFLLSLAFGGIGFFMHQWHITESIAFVTFLGVMIIYFMMVEWGRYPKKQLVVTYSEDLKQEIQ